MTKEGAPIVCTPGAMDAEQRERYRSLREKLYEHVQEVRELPQGYAFGYPYEPSVVVMAAEFMTLERLCCPFCPLRSSLKRVAACFGCV